jgi:hypothetical protein
MDLAGQASSDTIDYKLNLGDNFLSEGKLEEAKKCYESVAMKVIIY